MEAVKAARKGRQEAFLALFDEHHAPLFRFAYRLTGSSADAEDIVQECFLELLRPECAYDPRRTPIRIYLFGVVRNQWLKRQRRSAWTGEFDAEPYIDDSPETGLLESEIQDAVARAVTGLPATQREALILAHYEQMPLAEIARVMGIEVGAVKSRLERARARLRAVLAAHAPGSGRTR
ncbi:MAG TPA: RNA polymerase sigma factor [Bryobacteraceae bacterium]|nr:RNA polymerase sigma factor [Bryobacteraceae bacterium]